MTAFDRMRRWLAPANNGGRGRALPDPEQLFADIFAAHGGGAYGDAARYEDFRAVFLGSAQGKRVLYEILSWAGMFRPSFVPGDAFATHYRDGERNLGLRLLATINSAPGENVAAAETEEPEKE